MKTLFLDLGNVLVFFDHNKMCTQIAKLFSVPEDKIRHTLFLRNFGERYEKGEISSEELHEELCSLSEKKVPFEKLMHAAADIFSPNTSMIELLPKLKKNASLYLLSNTCEAHFHFILKYHPFIHLFDGYVLSYEVGARKPETKIYDYAIAKAKCKKENSFYVDDIEEYIDKAKSLGIEGHTYTQTPLLVKELQKRGYL